MRCLFILTIAFFFTSATCYSQKLKRKTEHYWWFKDKYYTDRATKHEQGSYWRIRFDSDENDTIIRGQYCNGQKCGYWTYQYAHDNLVYDYNDSAVKHLPKEISAYDSAYIPKNMGYVLAKVDRPALCLSYQYQICTAIKYNTVYNSGEAIKAVVSFVIDKTGKYRDVTVEQSAGKNIDKRLITTIKQSLDRLEWLPAKLEGQAIDSKLFIEMNFVGSKNKIPAIKRGKPYYQYIFFHPNGAEIY
jgi:hypothetical protein